MLALTLPWRGAVAQLACCGELPGSASLAAPAGHAAHAAGHDAHAGHDMHAGHEMHASAHADAGTDGTGTPGDGTNPDGCHHCMASCSTPAFVSSAPLLLAPVAAAQARFPALSAPPPSHPGEGQERPPRTV